MQIKIQIEKAEIMILQNSFLERELKSLAFFNPWGFDCMNFILFSF